MKTLIFILGAWLFKFFKKNKKEEINE